MRQRERIVGSSRPGAEDTKQEHGARRRLLQRFQERVGGVDVELVGLVDDDDAPGVLGGAVAQERAQLAHLVDGNGGGKALRLVVPRAADDEQPRMRERAHLTRGARGVRDTADRVALRSLGSASAARAKR